MHDEYQIDLSELDEFLAEYVDGTMDPVVRQAFEEFLEMYPEVARHVSCLTELRTELCRLGDRCRCKAPDGFQERLRRQVAAEMLGLPDRYHHVLSPKLSSLLLGFSAMFLVMVLAASYTIGPASEVDTSRANLLRTEALVPLAVSEHPSTFAPDVRPAIPRVGTTGMQLAGFQFTGAPSDHSLRAVAIDETKLFPAFLSDQNPSRAGSHALP
jgi:anti-sigma factor RsiW